MKSKECTPLMLVGKNYNEPKVSYMLAKFWWKNMKFLPIFIQFKILRFQCSCWYSCTRLYFFSFLLMTYSATLMNYILERERERALLVFVALFPFRCLFLSLCMWAQKEVQLLPPCKHPFSRSIFVLTRLTNLQVMIKRRKTWHN